MSDSSDDADLRAGEYVLGLGDAAERRAFAAECATDAALAQAAADWERRLAPLALGFAPVEPPPGLWQRISRNAFTPVTSASAASASVGLASVGPASVGPPPSRGMWRARLGAGAIGFALAASIAAVMVGERAPPPQAVPVAALLPKTAEAPVLVALRAPDGRLEIRAVGPLAAPAGRDYELWSLPAGAKAPIALGLLRDGRATVRTPTGDAQILVSLETSGGSPTGAPQGPVLWGGAYRAGG